MQKKIIQVLDKIRPSLRADGGDVELVEVDEKKGIVKVRLQGACVHCPMSQYTLRDGISASLKKEVPEVKEVISV